MKENPDVERVIDRNKVAASIHSILDSGIEMLKKKTFDKEDHTKIKLIRVMGSHVNAGVAMIQQETAQQRIQLIKERMAQLGYGGEERKQITA